jgi:hypothetical protein
MTPEHLAAHPLEGSLIAIQTDATGISEPKFGH